MKYTFKKTSLLTVKEHLDIIIIDKKDFLVDALVKLGLEPSTQIGIPR